MSPIRKGNQDVGVTPVFDSRFFGNAVRGKRFARTAQPLPGLPHLKTTFSGKPHLTAARAVKAIFLHRVIRAQSRDKFLRSTSPR